LLATDLTGLPPAHILTAELELLCGDGAAYAIRLHDVGAIRPLHPEHLELLRVAFPHAEDLVGLRRGFSTLRVVGVSCSTGTAGHVPLLQVR
jgi:acetyl esterase